MSWYIDSCIPKKKYVYEHPKKYQYSPYPINLKRYGKDPKLPIFFDEPQYRMSERRTE